MSAWRVTYSEGTTAYVAGPKTEARRRIAACGDNGPIWVERRRAWATSATVASAVLDQLERRNIAATTEDAAQGSLNLTETVPANLSASPRREQQLDLFGSDVA